MDSPVSKFKSHNPAPVPFKANSSRSLFSCNFFSASLRSVISFTKQNDILFPSYSMKSLVTSAGNVEPSFRQKTVSIVLIPPARVISRCCAQSCKSYLMSISSIETLDNSKISITGFDSSSSGIKTISATYDELSVTFAVNITSSSPVNITKSINIGSVSYSINIQYYSGTFGYEINNNEVTITDSLVDDTSLTIPTTIDGYPVTTIGFAAFFLNRCNRSGIMTGGPIVGYKQDSNWKINARFNKEDLVNRILKAASFRDKIKLYNLNAHDFLTNSTFKSKYESEKTSINSKNGINIRFINIFLQKFTY